MNKEKLYILTIIILVLAIIVGCALQSQHSNTPTSKIIVPKEGLTFQTPDGKVLLKIVASEYGGGLSVYNNQGKAVAVMTADEYGGMLIVCNNQEKPTVISMNNKEDGGRVDVYNNQMRIVASMAALQYGGVLCVSNNIGIPAADMYAFKDGGILHVFNYQRGSIWSKP